MYVYFNKKSSKCDGNNNLGQTIPWSTRHIWLQIYAFVNVQAIVFFNKISFWNKATDLNMLKASYHLKHVKSKVQYIKNYYRIHIKLAIIYASTSLPAFSPFLTSTWSVRLPEQAQRLWYSFWLLCELHNIKVNW